MMGQGRLYTVTARNQSLTAQVDFVYLKPAADKPIWLEKFKVVVAGGTADAGDAQEELLETQLIYLPSTVTAGSGGASFTPNPINPADSAAGFTARTGDTTKATTSGTSVDKDLDMLNNRIGTYELLAPEHRIYCPSPAALALRLNTTPADAIIMSWLALVREI